MSPGRRPSGCCGATACTVCRAWPPRSWRSEFALCSCSRHGVAVFLSCALHRAPVARKKRKTEDRKSASAAAAEEQDAWGLRSYERTARKQAATAAARTEPAPLPIKLPNGQLKVLQRAVREQASAAQRCCLKLSELLSSSGYFGALWLLRLPRQRDGHAPTGVHLAGSAASRGGWCGNSRLCSGACTAHHAGAASSWAEACSRPSPHRGAAAAGRRRTAGCKLSSCRWPCCCSRSCGPVCRSDPGETPSACRAAGAWSSFCGVLALCWCPGSSLSLEAGPGTLCTCAAVQQRVSGGTKEVQLSPARVISLTLSAERGLGAQDERADRRAQARQQIALAATRVLGAPQDHIASLNFLLSLVTDPDAQASA